MTRSPLVSVCVPTIGRTQYLEQTRRALAAQTLGDFELLILDNASPEPARVALEAWAQSEPRARILRVDPRIPMFPNFNRGISAARGKYVAICHDDDTYRPDFLAATVEMLERSATAGFSASNYDLIDEQGAVIEPRRLVRRKEVWPGRAYIDLLMRRAINPIPMSGIVYRRDALPEGFDETIPINWGDFVLLMRIAERFDVAVHDEPLVQVRRHREQASSIPCSKSIPMRTEVLRSYVREYRSRWPGDQDFAARLERHVPRAHRLGLIWGWLSAKDESEATECLAGLDANVFDAGARFALAQLGRLGLRSRVQGSGQLLSLGKSIGGRL